MIQKFLRTPMHLLALSSFLCLSSFLNAQQEGNLNFQRTIWQANRTNPAFLPEAKLTIGLPSIYNNLYLEESTLEDFVDIDNNQITLSNAINNLSDNNRFREYLDLETLSVGFYLGNFHLSLHHAIKVNAFLDFPKTLAQVIGEGNAQFIGETVDLSHDFQTFSYSELGLGLAYQLNENFSIGTRLKYLNGIGDISTTSGNLFLTTDEDIYQLRLDADYQVNSSALLEYNGLNDPDQIASLNALELGKIFTQNRGIAFDIGANLKFEDLDIALSILDIGQINWKENTRNYTVNDSYEYGGLDLVNAYLEDSLSSSTVLDSLESIFDVQESENNYSTTLPRRLYASFNYDLNENWTAGLGLYGEWYREEFYPALNLNAQTQLTDFLAVGASYTIFDQRFDHLGINAQLELGPVQLYAMTNNLLSAFRPRKSSQIDFRLGVNLLFGK